MNQLNNYVQLIGNVGAQPEIKETKNGNTYARVSLATNESYLDKTGQWENRTQWHNIVCWGKTALKMQESLNKGDQVLVRGKLEHRKYEDAQGNTKYMTQVIVSHFLPMRKRERVAV